MSGRAAFSLSPDQLAEVETLAAVLNAEQIADYFSVGRTTFFAMMRRDEEIAARYKRGKARAIGAIAQGLIQKARAGDTTSMIFYLKTQGGWRETLAIENLPEAILPTLDLSGVSDAALKEIAGAIRLQEAQSHDLGSDLALELTTSASGGPDLPELAE